MCSAPFCYGARERWQGQFTEPPEVSPGLVVEGPGQTRGYSLLIVDALQRAGDTAHTQAQGKKRRRAPNALRIVRDVSVPLDMTEAVATFL